MTSITATPVAQQRWTSRTSAGMVCMGVIDQRSSPSQWKRPDSSTIVGELGNNLPGTGTPTVGVLLLDSQRRRAALGQFGPKRKESPWDLMGEAALNCHTIATSPTATAVLGQNAKTKRWHCNVLFQSAGLVSDVASPVNLAFRAIEKKSDNSSLVVEKSEIGVAGDTMLFAFVVATTTHTLLKRDRRFLVVIDVHKGRHSVEALTTFDGPSVNIAVGPAKGQVRVSFTSIGPLRSAERFADVTPCRSVEEAISTFRRVPPESIGEENRVTSAQRFLRILHVTINVGPSAQCEGRFGVVTKHVEVLESRPFVPEQIPEGHTERVAPKNIISCLAHDDESSILVVVPQLTVSLVSIVSTNNPQRNSFAATVPGLCHPREATMVKLRPSDPHANFAVIIDDHGGLFAVERFGGVAPVTVASGTAWGMRHAAGKERIYGTATTTQSNQLQFAHEGHQTEAYKQQSTFSVVCAAPSFVLCCDGVVSILLKMTATVGSPGAPRSMLTRISTTIAASQVPLTVMLRYVDSVAPGASQRGYAMFAALVEATKGVARPQVATAAISTAVQKLISYSSVAGQDSAAHRLSWELRLGLLMWLREQLRLKDDGRQHALDNYLLHHALEFHRASCQPAIQTSSPKRNQDGNNAPPKTSQNAFDASTAALIASYAMSSMSDETRLLALKDHPSSKIMAVSTDAAQRFILALSRCDAKRFLRLENDYIRRSVATSQLSSGSWVVTINPNTAQQCRALAFAMLSHVMGLDVFIGLDPKEQVLRCGTTLESTSCQNAVRISSFGAAFSVQERQRLCVLACDLFSALGMVEMAFFVACASRRYHAAETILELYSYKMKDAEPTGTVAAAVGARLQQLITTTRNFTTKLDAARYAIDRLAANADVDFCAMTVILAAFLEDPLHQPHVVQIAKRHAPQLTLRLASVLVLHRVTAYLVNAQNDAAGAAYKSGTAGMVPDWGMSGVRKCWAALDPIINVEAIAAQYHSWRAPGGKPVAQAADYLQAQLVSYFRILLFVQYASDGISLASEGVVPEGSEHPGPSAAMTTLQVALMGFLSSRITIFATAALQTMVLDAAVQLARANDLTDEGKELVRTFIQRTVFITESHKSDNNRINALLAKLEAHIEIPALEKDVKPIPDQALKAVVDTATKLKEAGKMPRDRFTVAAYPLIWDAKDTSLDDLGVRGFGKHAIENQNWFLETWPAEQTAEFWTASSNAKKELSKLLPSRSAAKLTPAMSVALYATVCSMVPPQRLHSIIATGGVPEEKPKKSLATVGTDMRDDPVPTNPLSTALAAGKRITPKKKPSQLFKNDGTVDVAQLLSAPIDEIEKEEQEEERKAEEPMKKEATATDGVIPHSDVSPTRKDMEPKEKKPVLAATLTSSKFSVPSSQAKISNTALLSTTALNTLPTVSATTVNLSALSPMTGCTPNVADSLATGVSQAAAMATTAPKESDAQFASEGGVYKPSDVAWWETAAEADENVTRMATLAAGEVGKYGGPAQDDVSSTTATSYDDSMHGGHTPPRGRAREHRYLDRLRDDDHHHHHHRRHVHRHTCKRHSSSCRKQAKPPKEHKTDRTEALQSHLAGNLLTLRGSTQLPRREDMQQRLPAPLLPPGQAAVVQPTIPQAAVGVQAIVPMQPQLLNLGGGATHPTEQPPNQLLSFPTASDGQANRVQLFRFDDDNKVQRAGQAQAPPPVPMQPGAGLAAPIAPPTAFELRPPQTLTLSAPPPLTPQKDGLPPRLSLPTSPMRGMSPGGIVNIDDVRRMEEEARRKRKEERRKRKAEQQALKATQGGNAGTVDPSRPPQQPQPQAAQPQPQPSALQPPQQRQEDANRTYSHLQNETPLPAGVAMRQDDTTGQMQPVQSPSMLNAGGGGPILNAAEHQQFQRYVDDLLSRNPSAAMSGMQLASPAARQAQRDLQGAPSGYMGVPSMNDSHFFQEALAKQQAMLQLHQQQTGSMFQTLVDELRQDKRAAGTATPGSPTRPNRYESSILGQSMSQSLRDPPGHEKLGLSAVQQAELLQRSMDDRKKLVDLNQDLLDAQKKAMSSSLTRPRSANEVAEEALNRSMSRSPMRGRVATATAETGVATSVNLTDAATQGGAAPMSHMGAQTLNMQPSTLHSGAQTSPQKGMTVAAAPTAETKYDELATASAKASLAELGQLQQRIFDVNDTADAMERALQQSKESLERHQALFTATNAASENQAAMNTMKHRTAQLEHELRNATATSATASPQHLHAPPTLLGDNHSSYSPMEPQFTSVSGGAPAQPQQGTTTEHQFTSVTSEARDQPHVQQGEATEWAFKDTATTHVLGDGSRPQSALADTSRPHTADSRPVSVGDLLNHAVGGGGKNVSFSMPGKSPERPRSGNGGSFNTSLDVAPTSDRGRYATKKDIATLLGLPAPEEDEKPKKPRHHLSTTSKKEQREDASTIGSGSATATASMLLNQPPRPLHEVTNVQPSNRSRSTSQSKHSNKKVASGKYGMYLQDQPRKKSAPKSRIAPPQPTWDITTLLKSEPLPTGTFITPASTSYTQAASGHTWELKARRQESSVDDIKKSERAMLENHTQKRIDTLNKVFASGVLA